MVGRRGASHLNVARPYQDAHEIDALVTSVQELGRITETPTPIIDTVLGLICLRARTAGLYRNRFQIYVGFWDKARCAVTVKF